MDKIPCSVGILTFNSGATLRRTLESVRDFDDIVLCDGGSSDSTLDIAREYGARVILQPSTAKDSTGRLTHFGEARNASLDAARHDWFLYIDSDETASEGLVEEIRTAVASDKKQLVYRVPLGIKLDGRYLEYSSNYPGYQYRFFNKRSGAHFIKPVHERIAFTVPEDQIGTMKHPWYIHTSRTDWNSYFTDGRRYRDLAVRAFSNAPWPRLVHIVYRNVRAAAGVLFRASRNYVLHGTSRSVPVRGEMGRFMDPLALSFRLVWTKILGTRPNNSRPRIVYAAYMRMPTDRAHGIQVMKTCESLARAGREVELCIPGRHTDISELDPFAYYGVKRIFTITTLKVPDLVRFGKVGFVLSLYAFARAVRSYIGKDRSVVLMSRDERLLAQCSDTPYLWESHTGAWNRAARRVAKRAHKVLVLTHAAVRFYADKGVDEKKLVVVPDAIDTASFVDPEDVSVARTRLGLPLDKRIALYVGGLGGWKGTDTLFKASAYLHSVQVVCIGGTEKEVADASAKYPKVRFLGSRPYRELANNLSAGDVLVIPNTGTNPISVTFTSPLKLFAYMASGKPIVASDVPSIREVLDDHSAFLVTPDSPESLAKGIEEAFSDPEKAVHRATAARMLAARYTWDERARRILQVLKA